MPSVQKFYFAANWSARPILALGSFLHLAVVRLYRRAAVPADRALPIRRVALVPRLHGVHRPAASEGALIAVQAENEDDAFDIASGLDLSQLMCLPGADPLPAGVEVTPDEPGNDFSIDELNPADFEDA